MRAGEELLAHQSFVRRLAHELLRDAARADDLAQDAWVRALEHPPRVAGAARAWFRTVLARLAARGARDDSRRGARELAAARPEGEPSPDEVSERLQLGQELVRAVEALREPYRAAIFGRYFEGLSPGALARREGVPVATVKTRLRRALELLRTALDERRGRGAWALGLARLAAQPAAAAPGLALAAAGGLAVVAVAGGAWLAWRDGSLEPVARAEPLAATSYDGEERGEEVALVAAEPSPEEPARTSVAPGPAPGALTIGANGVTFTGGAPQQAAPEPQGPLVHGRVLFPDGSGARGATVCFGEVRTLSGRDGEFELVADGRWSSEPHAWVDESLERELALLAWLDGWAPARQDGVGARVAALRASGAERGAGRIDEALELVLPGEALAIEGTVLDRHGAPAAGWRYSLLDGGDAGRGPYRPFSAEELASGATGHVETGADGGFALGGLGAGRSYRVRAWNRATGEQIESAPLAAGTAGVVLRAPRDGWRPLVDGAVVGLDGTPLPDVSVALSITEYRVERGGAIQTWSDTVQESVTDAGGRFEFRDVPPCPTYVRVRGQNVSPGLELAPDAAGRDLRIELERDGGFVLELGEGERAPDRVCFLDDAGERLRIEVEVGPGSTQGVQELELSGRRVEGRVSERARWLVLLEGEVELARLAVLVRPGETTLLRW